MYDSINLPLSYKKIVKRTIKRFFTIHSYIILFVTYMYFLVLDTISVDKSSHIFPVMILLLSLSFLFLIPSIIYEYYYKKLYYYSFTDSQAEIRKGVLTKATGHINYDNIQNVYLDQDILDRILGLYDVHFETAGETSGFYSHVDGLVKENADKLVALLTSCQRKNNQDNENQTIEKNVPSTPIPDNQNTLSRESFKAQPALAKYIFIRTFLASCVILFFCSWFIWTLFSQSIFTSVSRMFWYGYFYITTLMTISAWIYARWFSLVWCQNYNFTFAEKGGEIKQKVIGQSIVYVDYDRIQNVVINQSMLESFYGLYRVSIETAAGSSSTGVSSGGLTIFGLDNEDAQKAKEFLLKKMKQYKSKL